MCHKNHHLNSNIYLSENVEHYCSKLLCSHTSQPEIGSQFLTTDGQSEGCLSGIHQFDGTNQVSIDARAESLLGRDENLKDP